MIQKQKKNMEQIQFFELLCLFENKIYKTMRNWNNAIFIRKIDSSHCCIKHGMYKTNIDSRINNIFMHGVITIAEFIIIIIDYYTYHDHRIH